MTRPGGRSRRTRPRRPAIAARWPAPAGIAIRVVTRGTGPTTARLVTVGAVWVTEWLPDPQPATTATPARAASRARLTSGELPGHTNADFTGNPAFHRRGSCGSLTGTNGTHPVHRPRAGAGTDPRSLRGRAAAQHLQDARSRRDGVPPVHALRRRHPDQARARPCAPRAGHPPGGAS